MLRPLLLDRIRSAGPITFAEFMETALYDPAGGYYATATQRSGRRGDFVTSVDVGAVYGELLARQVADAWVRLGRPASFDVVEAGAGNGRLLADLLDGLAATDAACYAAARVTAVERSEAARRALPDALARHAARLRPPTPSLPPRIEGVLFANELIDALPVHAVVRTGSGWAEVRVGCEGDRLVEIVVPASPAVEAWLADLGTLPRPGWRGEAGLAATAWVREAARALARGFVILVDYGHEAADLAAESHAGGTLIAYRSQRAFAGVAGCLDAPGERDMTAHVNLTAIRRAGEAEGLTHLGTVDQTYFLLGLGALDESSPAPDSAASLRRRLAIKTLVVPGGLGSTMKVMVLARGVGRPSLRGLSWPGRVT